MGGDNQDLVRLAGEYADRDIDLYHVLGVDALTPKEDIHRAWRKRSLKYHPDKARENFDAEKWELFEKARDVLSDANARAAYDGASKAKLLRRQEREAMDKERKKFADDLEARENAARRAREEVQQADREMLQKERERLAEQQRMRDEETRRQAEAAQEAEDLAEARRRLKEKRDEKARRRQAKESMKATLGSLGKPSGPANGVINVPGDYVADLSLNKRYWELVCDKLRAVQAVRNLQKDDTPAEILQEAERVVQEVRSKIHEAEVRYQNETAAT
ncbi:DNAJ domain protein Cwf23 [Metarhizium album ARSEF 1941]|uniref:DNAJ domain protein Cwf23 n=1 Tax=Metarhizium album (strain ARSEF 1941) TaxID=1081103 RepID=A0A0B2X2K6_METAS|nr:DNAJ domain protein Cwf23 [Metarhizium album ARSEF 1941]KHN99490.1 DNAJ domain protein Cwf23 [Metarhizium album ARSEF 1941]